MSISEREWQLLKDRLIASEQDHVLRWLDELSEGEKQTLYSDLSEIDLQALKNSFESAQQTMIDSSEKKDERLHPLDESIYASTSRDQDKIQTWNKAGLEKISNNEVGVLLLAGGQGTRLGVLYPKGMYDVGLPSQKTLYQLQAERILRLQQLAKDMFGRDSVIPWYIMTSEYTRETTVNFFESNNYFGIDQKNIIVFEQNTLPCIDFDGRLILDSKCSVSRAPDGNGGLYSALVNPRNNILEDMKQRGVQCVHVYGVDNILVKMADPVFVGYCSEKDADCGAKVVNKASPEEKVGVVCLLDGKYQVVEYSEISQKTAEMRNADGTLTFNAGNICNHYFTVPFLERVCSQFKDDLRHHVAKKKIPYIDEQGKRIVPTTPNGIKMEKFVFDVFQFSEKFAVLEVLREEDFSPLKNGPDSKADSPSSCRSALMKLHYKQLVSAGGSVLNEHGTVLPTDVNGLGVVCEISPLVSYSGEGLYELCNGVKFKQPVHLEVKK